MAPTISLPLLNEFSLPKVDFCPYNVLLPRNFIDDVKNTTSCTSTQTL